MELMKQILKEQRKSGSGSSEDTRSGFCGFECLKSHTVCEVVCLGLCNKTERGSF